MSHSNIYCSAALYFTTDIPLMKHEPQSYYVEYTRDKHRQIVQCEVKERLQASHHSEVPTLLIALAPHHRDTMKPWTDRLT